MTLSWNEIKDRALKFSKEWADTSNEEADAKPFLVEFFNVFGINRKRVSTFEHRVKKLDNKDGYIDLLWKGSILIEMKSRGKNLDKAYTQAIEYTHGLNAIVGVISNDYLLTLSTHIKTTDTKGVVQYPSPAKF